MEKALKILQVAKEEALEDLTGLTRITVQTSLDRLINQLTFLSGKQASGNTTVSHTQFKPVTNFMGSEIKRAEKVKPSDLKPEPSEKEKFVNKVKELEGNILSLTNDQVKERYSRPEDANIIRGVAKRAGLENFKDGVIDDLFLDDIRSAITSNQEEAANVSKANAKIKEADDNAAVDQKKVNQAAADFVEPETSTKKAKDEDKAK